VKGDIARDLSTGITRTPERVTRVDRHHSEEQQDVVCPSADSLSASLLKCKQAEKICVHSTPEEEV
jgi:hypothetical protein